jgi:hypothetical protein
MKAGGCCMDKREKINKNVKNDVQKNQKELDKAVEKTVADLMKKYPIFKRVK